jgi:DNA-binding transcriptional regulator YhcF (GntR family)
MDHRSSQQAAWRQEALLASKHRGDLRLKSAAGALFQAFADRCMPGRGSAAASAPLQAIADGRLAWAGLPSARQMAGELRSSRGAIDEALARLQDEGLLRRVGDGSYVASPLPQRADTGFLRRRRVTNNAAQQALRHMAPLMCSRAF